MGGSGLGCPLVGVGEHHRDNNPISPLRVASMLQSSKNKGTGFKVLFHSDKFHLTEFIFKEPGTRVRLMSTINFPRKGIKQTSISLNSTSRSSPSKGPHTPLHGLERFSNQFAKWKAQAEKSLNKAEKYFTPNPWRILGIILLSKEFLIYCSSGGRVMRPIKNHLHSIDRKPIKLSRDYFNQAPDPDSVCECLRAIKVARSVNRKARTARKKFIIHLILLCFSVLSSSSMSTFNINASAIDLPHTT